MNKEEAKEKIRAWLKDRHNLAFLAILLFAVILRLYFFSLTINQPLWWDESEYMLKAKNIALGTPDTGWTQLRPFLFPYFSSIFFYFGFGIGFIKFILILLSIANIILVYVVGKNLFSKKAALIATFLFSVFYLDLFWGNRIGTNSPELFFGLLIFFFFLQYWKHGKENYLILIFPLTAVGYLLRFTSLLYLLIIILFLLIVKRKEAFKIKKLNYSLLIFVIIAIPVFIFAFLSGTNLFLNLQNALQGTTLYRGFSTAIPVTFKYMNLVFFSLQGKPFTGIFYLLNFLLFALFIIGLLSFYKLFLMLDDVFSGGKKYSNYLLILIWLIIALLFYGSVIDIFDDRYFLMAFPAIFLVIGLGAESIFNIIKKSSKYLSIIVIVAVLLLGGYSLISHSDEIVKFKLNTYDSLKTAGLWIKDNSSPGDFIISSAVPQLTYYSERSTFHFNSTQQEFYNFIQEKKPKYVILTAWEKSPDWVYKWYQNNSDIELVNAFASKDTAQPTTIIYKLKI
ncbi:glycosyltransferase family 39 protein [Candidatus Pacearchaeota archaeon]|nr:glycosyltransferase family 39 protein [Candidatus Pacearchaeota archaeon]